MTKFFLVLCSGCPESRIDAARIENYLKKNSWKKTVSLNHADLILYRSCGLTEKTAQDSLLIIKKIKSEKKEDAKFLVWGCLPKIDPDFLRSEYIGDTFDENDTRVLDDIIKPTRPLEGVAGNHVIPSFELKRKTPVALLGKTLDFIQGRLSITPNEKIFTIKVSTGCLGNCSFCAVRISRGLVKSKSIDKILTEFKDGLMKGYRYFSLLGTDLGSKENVRCLLIKPHDTLNKIFNSVFSIH
ncbi:hypothetical protein ACFLRN_10820 [Thermoproteota archaeon]